MICDARKVPSEYESPIDKICYDGCDPVASFLKKFNVTPNQITTVGLIMGLLSFYCITQKMFILAFVLYWITFFLDCLDGHYARKYNMTSTFGDYYDHIRDVLVNTLIIGAIWFHLTKNQKILYVVILTASALAMFTHIGCQELNSRLNEHNESLLWSKTLCPDKAMVKFTKFFGCGTFILIVSIYILYLTVNKKNEKI